jgi:16S rRNA (uracil1498-N3)-methyltransferase
MFYGRIALAKIAIPADDAKINCTMARRRFFVDRIHNQQAEVSGDDAHHLTRVLRVERGEFYEVSDGESAYLAEVVEAHKARVVFQIVEPVAAKPEAARVSLYVALIKFERMEWIYEKATELGVARIVPVVAERSERGLDLAVLKRLARWEKIAHEASQQSRRDQLPEIAPLEKLVQTLQCAPGLRLFAEEAPGAMPLLNSLPAAPTAGEHVSILVGPEGGWADREREAALQAKWLAVSLGATVLRAETAAITATAVVQAHWAAKAAANTLR